MIPVTPLLSYLVVESNSRSQHNNQDQNVQADFTVCGSQSCFSLTTAPPVVK